MKTQVQVLIQKIERDEKLEQLENSFAGNNYFRIPVQALKNEIATAHKMRPIRILKPQGNDFVGRVIEALLHDQSVRSRLAEINLQAFRVEKNLEAGIKAARDYVIVKYATDLSMYKTKEERLRIVDLVLEKYIAYQDKVSSVRAMSTMVIDDIDRGAWALKSAIEAYKLVSKPEGYI